MSIVLQNDDLVTRDNQAALYHEQTTAAALEKVLATGDLSKLSTQERLLYYRKTCESCGLNPLTKPFIYITLNSKLMLYPVKECAEQLRMNHGVAIKVTRREALFDDSIYQVTVVAQDRRGRTDEATGCVAIKGLQGLDLANALMKAETKAKRRVTFSICGLGWMADETERLEEQPYALLADGGSGPAVDMETGEIDDLDPGLAEIHDPVKDERSYKARTALLETIRKWAVTQDMAWAPVSHIFNGVIDELESKFGNMNSEKWLGALYQKIVDNYDAVSNQLQQKTDSEPVTKPENDSASDAWEQMIKDAGGATGLNAVEREPGDD
jgi:hypothetical protein